MSNAALNPVRIGFISRIDFGSDGYRQWLVERAAQTFQVHNAAFVVLLGGLIAGRAVVTKSKKLARELRAADRVLKTLRRELAALEKEADSETPRKPRARKAPATKSRRSGSPESRASELADLIAKQEGEVETLKDMLASFSPERMAGVLAERLPHFVNRAGQPIKLYIVPSTPYDKDIGIEVANLLAENRGNQEIRVLATDGDRLPLPWDEAGIEKVLEVLTLDKQPWLRGDFDSTSPQRRIKDKRRQTTQRTPVDIQAVGGAGVSIMKPEGQYPIGFMAVPVCHKIEETTTAERQVGVQIMEVDPDRRNVTMHSYPFRDFLSLERKFVEVPATFSEIARKCIAHIQANGKTTTGRFVDLTGLPRPQIEAELAKVAAGSKNRHRKTWPGLVHDEKSDRWDFDLEWIKMNLRCPPDAGERKVDKMVCVCCLHAGSHDTDYRHFLKGLPEVMLRHGVTTLISAGDHVEGTAHDLLMKGEIVAGFDNTKQEKLAGYMIADVLYRVFEARYEAACRGVADFSSAENRRRVEASLPRFVYVPGNHCTWIAHAGIQPLVTMIHVIVETLTRRIGKRLSAKDHRVDGLMDLVKSHIETNRTGRFTMPSGLKMGMTHPHMGGSKTVSSSAQQALDMYRDRQVVIIGNFHTGCVVEEHDPQLGQRICIQVGTMKHSSPFESSKLKPGLDQGFAYAKITSVDGRIVSTETTFFSNDRATDDEKHLDGDKPFRDFLDFLGISENAR